MGTSSFSSDARVGSAAPCRSISARTLPVWGTHYLPVLITIATTAVPVNLPCFIFSISPCIRERCQPRFLGGKIGSGLQMTFSMVTDVGRGGAARKQSPCLSPQAELRFELKPAIPFLHNSPCLKFLPYARSALWGHREYSRSLLFPTAFQKLEDTQGPRQIPSSR